MIDDLDEDSPDLTDEEVAGALATTRELDFVMAAVAFLGGRPKPSFALRRRGAVYYARACVAGETKVFRLDWLQKDTT